jgi:myo-inositol-1(or 4)-monophosphatase
MNKIELEKFIIKISRGAGKILRKKFRNIGYVKFKDAFGDPVTDADYASENYIISNIKKHYPDHKILSEEGGGDGFDGGGYLWIIDPLDGTYNFSKNVPIFCVSIALSYKKEIILGAIYDPIHDELFWGVKGGGSFLNGEKIMVSKLTAPKKTKLMMAWGGLNKDVIDYFNVLSKKEFSKVRANGSAALSFAYVSAGRGDVFIGLGCNLWDVAAGIIIAKEAGAKITDIDGNEWTIDKNRCVAANKNLLKKITD